MSARRSPHWQLLSAGWRISGGWSAYRLLTIGFVLVGVGCFAGSTSLVQKPAIQQFSAGLSILPFVFLWLLQSTTLLRFNHPVDARLVPLQLRCLRETLLGMWLAFVAVASVAVVLATSLPFGNSVLILLIIAAAALVPLLWIRWPLLLAPIALLWFFLQWHGAAAMFSGVAHSVQNLLHSAVDPHPYLTCLFVMIAMLPLARLLTHGIVRAGGEAHATRFRLSLLATGKPQTHGGPGKSSGLIIGMPRLNRSQRAVLSWSQGSSGSVLQRVVGMRFESGTASRILVPYAVVVLVVCSGLVFQSTTTASLVLGLGCVWAVTESLIGRSTVMGQSAKEHALWMLLPGMPRGTTLNRALAKRFLRDSLVTWGGVAVLSMAPSLFRTATLPWDGTWLTLVLIGLLPSAVFAISDWSRLSLAPTALQGGNALLWCTVGPLLSIAAFVILGVAVWLLAFCAVLTTALLLGWRWHQLAHYPAALPAGRLR